MRCYELETINRASSGWGVREGFVREGFPGKKTLVWPPVTLVRVEVSWCVVKEELPWIGNSKYPWARMRLIGIGHSESYRPVWSLSDWRNTVIAFRTTLCLIFGVLSPQKWEGIEWSYVWQWLMWLAFWTYPSVLLLRRDCREVRVAKFIVQWFGSQTVIYH